MNPEEYLLAQNYPNPFNNNTRIKFHIPEHNDRNNLLVRLEVFNAIGEKITSLIEEELAGGHHEKVFDASELSSGIYFYKLTVDDSFNIRKMILLK
jgi:hypothetical protein